MAMDLFSESIRFHGDIFIFSQSGYLKSVINMLYYTINYWDKQHECCQHFRHDNHGGANVIIDIFSYY